MLDIYNVVLDVIGGLGNVVAQMERRDGDLARQTRRAAASVALNIAEGAGARGKNRGLRYQTALGSARETMACLQVARAFRYVPEIDAQLEDQLRKVIGTLVRVVQRG